VLHAKRKEVAQTAHRGWPNDLVNESVGEGEEEEDDVFYDALLP
jgi:hypothetical protein